MRVWPTQYRLLGAHRFDERCWARTVKDTSHAGLVHPHDNQVIMRILRPYELLPPFFQELCPTRVSIDPTFVQGSVFMVPWCSNGLWYPQKAMTLAPVLSFPDFKISFVQETDASNMGIGFVLMQMGHPIAYFSKQFCPKLLRSSTYICELHAITIAVKR